MAEFIVWTGPDTRFASSQATIAATTSRAATRKAMIRTYAAGRTDTDVRGVSVVTAVSVMRILADERRRRPRGRDPGCRCGAPRGRATPVHTVVRRPAKPSGRLPGWS